MKTGIIGYGNIGKEIANFLKESDFFELKYIHDIAEGDFDSFDDVIQKSELIIEAAGKEAVKKIIKQYLKSKKVMIMSTSGLVGEDISNIEIIVPVGAISGIDSLKAVKDLIKELQLITTKPASSLGGKIEKKEIIFEGELEEAIEKFPKNINVAATLYLATNIKPKIKIIADPNAKLNQHRIIAKGSFGELDLITKNKPSKNPKTSYLAILSAFQSLKEIEKTSKKYSQ